MVITQQMDTSVAVTLTLDSTHIYFHAQSFSQLADIFSGLYERTLDAANKAIEDAAKAEEKAANVG